MEFLKDSTYFFDSARSAFPPLFSEQRYVWEALPTLPEYIEEQFRSGALTPNYKNKANVYIGEGTVVQEGVEIVGPAIIGKNCFIGHGAFLREYVLFADNVHIGHAVEVKHSIFLEYATAAHLNYVGNSIIGGRANISGGAILANYRLDKKNIYIKNKEEVIDTGMEKFGAVVGDGVTVGVNAVLNPGTILGKNTIVYPLTSVSGVHPEHSVLKRA